MDIYIEPSLDAYVHSSTNDNWPEAFENVLPRSQAPYLESEFVTSTPSSGMHVQLDAGWATLALPPNKSILEILPKLALSWRTPIDINM